MLYEGEDTVGTQVFRQMILSTFRWFSGQTGDRNDRIIIPLESLQQTLQSSIFMSKTKLN